MSVKRLIRGCKKGELKSQEKLYQLLSPKLFAVSLKYCRSYEEAEDNLHDAFITLFNKIDQFDFKGSFEGWAKRITINTALQNYRKQQVFDIIDYSNIEETEEELSVEQTQISTDFLLGCIHELPYRYQVVFSLYVLDDYSHQEIAEILKISIGTSKSNLSRARQLLRDKITDHERSSSFRKHTP